MKRSKSWTRWPKNLRRSTKNSLSRRWRRSFSVKRKLRLKDKLSPTKTREERRDKENSSRCNRRKIKFAHKKPPKKTNFWNKLRKRDNWKRKQGWRNFKKPSAREQRKLRKRSPKPWFSLRRAWNLKKCQKNMWKTKSLKSSQAKKEPTKRWVKPRKQRRKVWKWWSKR